MIPSEETRVAPRRMLRCRAKVVLLDSTVMNGRTIDISISGVCVMVEGPVPVNQPCVIAFEASVNGALRQVKAAAKAVYSICGSEGFRTGFQFSPLSPENMAIISYLAPP